jgi:hypothetical protein
MEDMGAYASANATDPGETDADDDVDPTWEPEELDREYEKNADDNDNSTQRQYVFN